MKDNLTAKQEGFCQSVATGLSYAQAYRDNYDSKNMTDKSIWELASREMSKVKVASRIISLQEMATERTMVTIQSISEELDENRMMAAKLDQPAAMNGATMGKAKVNGLLVEQVETKLVADVNFNGPECDL